MTTRRSARLKDTLSQPTNHRPTKRLKRNPIKIEYNHADPVIEHLRIYYSNCDSESRVFHDDEILDEISLEGLSGITLPRLFVILDAKFPNLRCTSNENSQNFVWSVIVRKFMRYSLNSMVRAYYIDPNTRDPEASSRDDTDKKLFIDKPITLPAQTIKHSTWLDRLLVPVLDGSIMGHCSNYSSRDDITDELVESVDNDGVEISLHKLNTRFGIGNVYFVASQTLRSRAILPKWADPHVDIKLREYCTLELIGKFRTLGVVFPKDKTLGRYRIMLLAKGFINQFQASMSCPIEHLLIRFSNSRSSLKNFAVRDKSNDPQSDDDEDHSLSLRRLCLDPMMIKPDRSVLSTIYDVILNSDNGLTQLDLRRLLHIPRFHVRNHLKNLTSLKMICSKESKNPNDLFRFYKPAHKAAKKRTKRELDKPTGVMASWDEADLRAKRILGLKRSSFTQAEDSLLISCRITSILIDPKLRLSWCVHKRLVRDLLHRELIESHDKTSDACLRRIKYLKRLPNNIMSINELTAELRDDNDILRLLKIEVKSEQKLNRLFTQVLKTVRAKIPNLLGLKEMDSKETRDDGPQVANYDSFRTNFDLIDCQPLNLIPKTPSVSFLLNRYQSNSLMQLTQPLNGSYKIDLSENNEINSIALLTSLCSMSSFKLNLDINIPLNVIGIDQGNENFKNLCEKDSTKHIVAKFMSRCGESLVIDRPALDKCGSLSDCLIVHPCRVRFYSDEALNEVKMDELTDLDAGTRLWKTIDGKVHLATLIKLIESLLSWIIVFPGIELDLLSKEFVHLVPEEHLLELLTLMERLSLISQSQLEMRRNKVRLFGYSNEESVSKITTFEANSGCYVRFCQLMDHYQ